MNIVGFYLSSYLRAVSLAVFFFFLFFFFDKVLLYLPGWSTVMLSQLTVISVSGVQVILMPQPPE